MKRKILFVLSISLLIVNSCKKNDKITDPDKIVSGDYDVMINGKLVAATGFGMGVDDSGKQRNWVSNDSTSLILFYPGSPLTWGASFITVNGDPVSTGKHWIDISKCDSLSVEMRGEHGNESVKIGLKDKDDNDDGSETTISRSLTQNWIIYKFKLTEFKTCDLTKVYVVTEFVFPGNSPGSGKVYVKNIRILK